MIARERRQGRWLGFLLLCLLGCHAAQPRQDRALVVVIESSPNSLDPRVGTDAQSERIAGLIFDPLVHKDERFAFQPWLAESWDRPDGLTWRFHLRDGVRFHDGRALEAEDVAWTLNSLVDGRLVSAKTGSFASVGRVWARDRLTVEVDMKRDDESLLFNLSDGLFGVVPRGAGKELGERPVGSGPFRFISQATDKEVVLERVAGWRDALPMAANRVHTVRFAVVPDAVTTALELEKGSADVAVNAVTLDMVRVLGQRPGLKVDSGPGSEVMYLNFNCTAGALRDKRVRQAVALAMDRQAMVDALWLGRARLAWTLLPPEHWAAVREDQVAAWPHDAGRAAALLEAAGYRADKDRVRVRLEMKTSTDETTRLLAQVMQQQLRAAGIELTLRSSEFGTFYADVTRGAFEMYALRWVGSNEDPDIFRYGFASSQMPPVGGNRGRYSNARVDGLLTRAASTADERERREAYGEVQQVLAEEVPAVPLWWLDNNVVHGAGVGGVRTGGSGSYEWLRDAVVK